MRSLDTDEKMILEDESSDSTSSFGKVTPPTPQTPDEKVKLSLTHGDVSLFLEVSRMYQGSISTEFSQYRKAISQDKGSSVKLSKLDSPAALALGFLDYLRTSDGSGLSTRAVLTAFEDEFLGDTDIHSLVQALGQSSSLNWLQQYFSTIAAIGAQGKPPQSSLFRNGKSSGRKLYAICGGQGSSNTTCLKELRELHAIYGSQIETLLNVASETLERLSRLPEAGGFYDEFGFDVRSWIENPHVCPDDDIVPLAPISFPLIGLLTFAHFCVTCVSLVQTPGAVRDAFSGLTGHSQGVVAAAAIARSTDWPTFYESVAIALEILFWVGLGTHQNVQFPPVPFEHIEKCVDEMEGAPSPMLSIRGLDRSTLSKHVEEHNGQLESSYQVFVSLINSRNNIVVAGPPTSLHALTLRLKKIGINEATDQSKVVFHKRKPVIQYQFLPMSSAFHCPYSSRATSFILSRLRHLKFNGSDLKTSLFHTRTAEDLRLYGDRDIIGPLVEMVCGEMVDWPHVTNFKPDSIVIDFGPGKLGVLTKKSTEGTNVRVILASEFVSSTRGVGSKAELFSPSMPPNEPNWEDVFRPRLLIDSSRSTILDTKMTRAFGVPPIMVAGMTPTTIHWDYVASIINAGYHAELACGGYHSAEDLENAIMKLSSNIPWTRGITCNIIYANPKAVQWQIPLIRSMVEKGFPIEGLTIGAGVPSSEVVEEYIKNLGLKHISFKPGSVGSIKEVLEIAKKHQDFPIGLQWTGGRAGGHHSYEDFHQPILDMYSHIRQCDNIVLIAGSGFGGSEDSFPYLSGQWSKSMGYSAMPFDGVLLGSRMMIAKEAHTSPQAKLLIAEAKGVADNEWYNTYNAATGGVITVQSEMGQPIHKLATRGVTLWNELDKMIFNIKDRGRRLEKLQANRQWIIERLNNDFQKPWFAVNSSGESVELEDMTYLEVLQRLVTLTYVHHEERWIHSSYRSLVSDFSLRIGERLSRNVKCPENSLLNYPNKFLKYFSGACPDAEIETIHPEDVSFFMGLCNIKGRKPVNFIPKLDENFETWFKKDSLWQAEDVEAVLDQDAQRTCIIHGPVAAGHSNIVDEPAKTILDRIYYSFIDILRSEEPRQVSEDPFNGKELTKILPDSLRPLIIEDTVTRKAYGFPQFGTLPSASSFRKSLRSDVSGWARACISEPTIHQGHVARPNPIRSAIVPIHSHTISIEYTMERQVTLINVSVAVPPSEPPRQVLQISCLDGKHVTAVLSHSSKSCSNVKLEFRFEYRSDGTMSKLFEDTKGRNQAIKDFYASLWIQQDINELQTTSLNHEFKGERLVLTRELVQKFKSALVSPNTMGAYEESVGNVVPIDICIVVAWKALVKPLLTRAIDCDLLQLLHRSNEFRYVEDSSPLKIGDTVQSSSRVQSVTIQDGNKFVEIAASIQRQGTTVVEVLSKFYCKGPFSDYENTMSRNVEPEFEIFVKSEKELALLASRQWLELHCEPKELISKTLHIETTTQTTFDQHGHYTSLHVVGTVATKVGSQTQLVGNIYFEHGNCQNNPILSFLKRHGQQVGSPQPIQNPGLNGKSTWKIKSPKKGKAYGEISKDINPIHTSPIFAHYAQLPGIVNHGMCTSAIVRRVLERTVANADPSRFRRYTASFEGIVFPGNELKIQIQHVAMVQGRMLFTVQAFNEDTGEKVLEAEAEVEQARTAYVFTGQGSQEKNMGMQLYESSEAAKTLWDNIDRHLMELYGFSIIDIVRNDPKSLKVHFRGAKGRKIRDNYLAMTISRTSSDGVVSQEPILKGLTSTSQSYTFSDPRGLLYSTQFAQPAITLMELAAFVDLRAKGLIQEGASYAGHSLGEYSALGALAQAIPMGDLVGLVFYRGLTMQVAMERDKAGRTEFSMMAVNPSRVHREFTQQELEAVIGSITKETGLLLEIVNFNVQGRQYVCAGHLHTLWTLTQVLNDISEMKDSFPGEEEIYKLISKKIQASQEIPQPIELERGAATIPLRGIDVPFHSTYLRNGIPAYRSYLKSKILEDNIDLNKLNGFIPNVMAKPFSTDRYYVEEAARTTESESLKQLLADWTEE